MMWVRMLRDVPGCYEHVYRKGTMVEGEFQEFDGVRSVWVVEGHGLGTRLYAEDAVPERVDEGAAFTGICSECGQAYKP